MYELIVGMAFRLAQATDRPAFAVDYRPAPAYPYPAAIRM
jgi:virginiamycin B lyase